MSADSALAEALARVEHKLDVAIHLGVQILNNSGNGPGVQDLPQVGDQQHLCPLCGQQPKYQVDIFAAIVTRKCGCGTGMVPVDLNALAPPTLTSRSSYAGSDGRGQSEDGGATGDSPGRAGPNSPSTR